MSRLLSVNVGLPRELEWQGKLVRTAIWKQPVPHRVVARRLNLDGDGQGDLQGHGGEQRAVMVTAVMLGLLVTSLPVALFVFKLPSWFDLLRVGAAGLLMGSAQFLVVRALSLAPASTIAPMQYTMIVWALAYGSLFFGNEVEPFVVLGAGIVIASSLYIMHRERIRGRTLRAHVK